MLLKAIPLPPISKQKHNIKKPRESYLAIEAIKTKQKTNSFKNFERNCKFYPKNAKIRDNKLLEIISFALKTLQ